MIFSSYIFLLYFLPVALFLYYISPRVIRHLTLVLVSYVFYGWANPLFMPLMLLQTTIDYVCGLFLAGQFGSAWRRPVEMLPVGVPRTRGQKLALTISLVSNLTLLGFFKYFNFGIESYNSLVHSLGLEAFQWQTFFRVTLPLGISFYTFQSMSYAIDVYRGDAKVIRKFIDYACYVTMFPHLVAGPIIRFREVAAQIESRTHTLEKFARGVAFLSLGMAKKILLANPCGKVADTCFDAGSVLPSDAWYGLFAYAFQIYFDFSAYSDMAIGLGLMIGFVFPKNFDSPYRSESITELWRRWHLSLSFWLRDNLYLPLGGNRLGEGRTYFNLMAVMLLGGLWHGASWNFVIWGAIHGGMLAFERTQGKESIYANLPRPIRIGITFLVTCLAWIFFRAHDLPAAIDYMKNMAGAGAVQPGSGLIAGLIYQPYYVLSFGIAAVIVWTAPQTWDFTRRISLAKALYCLFMLAVSIAVMQTQSYNPFIYFIF